MDFSKPASGSAPPVEDPAALQKLANEIRYSAMTMTNHSGLGHTGGDLSSADILATLYLGGILRVEPTNPTWPQRDRFVMSKGHCSGAFYSALAFRGFFSARDAVNIHGSSFRAEWPSRPKQTPGRGGQYGAVGAWSTDAVGAAFGSANAGRELESLCADG